MSHQNKKSLFQQGYERLQSMCGYGRSKHEDKALKLDKRYIYSFNCMKTYQKHTNYFAVVQNVCGSSGTSGTYAEDTGRVRAIC